MSTRDDPLVRPRETPRRLFYATGILLDADDFTDEQTYHRGRLARALAYLHGHGTVAGLRVDWEAALAPGEDPDFPDGREEQLLVQPGLAIDRIGRLIELPRPACIRLDRWYQAQDAEALRQGLHGTPVAGVTVGDGITIDEAVVVDLFVRFTVCEQGKTPAFAAGPYNALDAVMPSRLQDGYELELVIRTEADPPLPQPLWPDLAAVPPADRAGALRAAILQAWREGTAFTDLGGLTPLPEHALGQDPTALFLARLLLPATAAASPAPPIRGTQPVQVGNDARPLVYPSGALARWLGL
ncbi:hypothetical protein FKZ61_012090 [Litorilinea aerophila]|uniref:Uncharacterized protein n=1 Tax=Litorilinea aerophila TaxID=1204385 RepID=A0A540VFQ3_9CHLR|nr:hypothetical protein [Litorilinea aerophila]MCC9076848.1 hypothetical protein [Litorilinea aerophila]